MLAGAVTHAIPVVGRIVAEEVGDGRVEIAAVEDDQHVIDHAGDIDEVFVGGVGGAVHVQPLHLEVIHVVGETIGGRLPEPIPSCIVAVRRTADIAIQLFDCVVVVCFTSQIGGGKGGLGTFIGVVESPIHAVDVEMIEVAVRGDLAHGELRVARGEIPHAHHAGVTAEAP